MDGRSVRLSSTQIVLLVGEKVSESCKHKIEFCREDPEKEGTDKRNEKFCDDLERGEKDVDRRAIKISPTRAALSRLLGSPPDVVVLAT